MILTITGIAGIAKGFGKVLTKTGTTVTKKSASVANDVNRSAVANTVAKG